MDDRRQTAIEDLVFIRRPIAEAQRTLSRFDWDYPDPLVTLTKQDVLRALQLHESGSLTDSDLEDWAETVQGRDEVEYETKFRDALSDLIFEISTPEICGSASDNTAQWKLRLLR